MNELGSATIDYDESMNPYKEPLAESSLPVTSTISGVKSTKWIAILASCAITFLMAGMVNALTDGYPKLPLMLGRILFLFPLVPGSIILAWIVKDGWLSHGFFYALLQPLMWLMAGILFHGIPPRILGVLPIIATIIAIYSVSSLAITLTTMKVTRLFLRESREA